MARLVWHDRVDVSSHPQRPAPTGEAAEVRSRLGRRREFISRKLARTLHQLARVEADGAAVMARAAEITRDPAAAERRRRVASEAEEHRRRASALAAEMERNAFAR